MNTLSPRPRTSYSWRCWHRQPRSLRCYHRRSLTHPERQHLPLESRVATDCANGCQWTKHPSRCNGATRDADHEALTKRFQTNRRQSHRLPRPGQRIPAAQSHRAAPASTSAPARLPCTSNVLPASAAPSVQRRQPIVAAAPALQARPQLLRRNYAMIEAAMMAAKMAARTAAKSAARMAAKLAARVAARMSATTAVQTTAERMSAIVAAKGTGAGPRPHLWGSRPVSLAHSTQSCVHY